MATVRLTVMLVAILIALFALFLREGGVDDGCVRGYETCEETP